ncbi:MAG: ATP-dependent helicase [Nocardioides sp.]
MRHADAKIESPEQLRELMRESFTLSDAQWQIVSAPLAPAVVIAGAGSGKTSVMAARVLFLVANGLVTADQVLGLTFTTKAAAELRSRVTRALAVAGLGRAAARSPDGIGRPLIESGDADDEVLEPTITTYNAYAAGLLTEHGLRIGCEPDLRVMADAGRYQVAAQAVARHRGRVDTLSDHPKTAIDYILALDGQLSEHLVHPDEVRVFDEKVRAQAIAELGSGAKADLEKLLLAIARRSELLDLVQAYRALKADLGLIDFSDQIALAARLATEHPAVGRLERQRFPVVVLDEYQDTSVAQAQLLARLFSGPNRARGRGHCVTAVGDPNQAIYGWRGASVSNIMNFADTFPAAPRHQVARFPLTTSQRSDLRILEVANRLAAPLLADQDQVQRLTARADAGLGHVQAIVHTTYGEELHWLAAQVSQTHEQGTGWSEIGVLTRDNAHAADVFDTLSRSGIPVEIVGLKGLLALPEVSMVVATLQLLLDLTANAALLHLLSGPRWAIGPRDLALLGRRAKDISQSRGRSAASHKVGAAASLADELAAAVAGADPVEVAALSDALDDPGEAQFSTEARQRFALLSAELRRLRAHVGEPLIELVGRIIDACGIDVELASSVSGAARARRDNLDLFVKAVADFQAVDGDVSLPALLAYLSAEDEMGTGLDVATPSAADSVKLLTVHRAKGLEFDAVFLPGVCEQKFPNTRGRSQWTTTPAVLPIALRGDSADLPALREVSAAGLKEFREAVRAHQATEELRLGYVAFTRARHHLWVSSYLWAETRATPVGPSPYQQTVRDALKDWGEQPRAWLDKPEKGTTNPLRSTPREVPWPVTERSAEALRRIAAAERVRLVDPAAEDDLDLADAALVAQWDADIDRLLAELAREQSPVVDVSVPTSLSATSLARLRDDPAGFARELVRPMPRPPSPAARFGTRFHAWVESRFDQQNLFEPDELPGQADAGIDSDAELAAVIAAFETGPFADRLPRAVEAPFALVLAGQVVRGRIDAVYGDTDGYLVIDWKTGQRHPASRSADDPLQLAIYRLAWAEVAGVRLEQVRAGFYYVRSGELVEPDSLPDRAEVEDWFARLVQSR